MCISIFGQMLMTKLTSDLSDDDTNDPRGTGEWSNHGINKHISGKIHFTNEGVCRRYSYSYNPRKLLTIKSIKMFSIQTVVLKLLK